jgi:hypothetical protein
VRLGWRCPDRSQSSHNPGIPFKKMTREVSAATTERVGAIELFRKLLSHVLASSRQSAIKARKKNGLACSQKKK